MAICASFAGEACAGTKISAAMPARAAYAARLAAAFPDESSTTRVTPSVWSALTNTAVPRSLNEPVGIRKSSLERNAKEPSRASTSGVKPSPIEMGSAFSGSGMKARYRHSVALLASIRAGSKRGASAISHQPHVLDVHGAVDRFGHIVDGQPVETLFL